VVDTGDVRHGGCRSETGGLGESTLEDCIYRDRGCLKKTSIYIEKPTEILGATRKKKFEDIRN